MTPAPPATSNISSSTGKHQQLPPVFPALHTLPPTYFALPDYTALFGGLPACLPTHCHSASHPAQATLVAAVCQHFSLMQACSEWRREN